MSSTPLVSRSPVETARPGHIATLKTFDPPPSALEGQRFAGSRRWGKNLLFPTEDGELVVRVHLMSAGRLRYLPAGKQGPEEADVPDSLRRRRRAPAHGGGQEEACRSLAPDTGAARRRARTPRARTPSRSTSRPSAAILGRERRQLHPLLRDQRALAGIGRAHANEILWEARLSPFRLSTDLGDEETETLARAIHDDLARGLELRLAGKGDAAVYRIHGHFGEPCPRCGETLRRVDFEEHTITYCPTCQTGGRILKDRRLSRLLR